MKISGTRIVCWFTGIVLICSLSAFGFDFTTGRSIGIGKAIVLSDPTASALVSSPSIDIPTGQWLVELGANRKFEIKDLDELFFAAAYRYQKFTGAIGMSQFGYQDFYAERTFKLGLSYQYETVGLGMTFSSLFVSFGRGYESLSASTIGLSLGYRYQRFYGSFIADNLTSPTLYDGGVAIRPKYTAYLELLGYGSYSITGRATFEKTEDPQFTIGQKLNLSSRASILWGLSSGPLTYGGGVEFIIKDAHITYAASYHPVLGFTHGMALSYGGGTNMSPIQKTGVQ